jgi:hypothetical protein
MRSESTSKAAAMNVADPVTNSDDVMRPHFGGGGNCLQMQRVVANILNNHSQLLTMSGPTI